MKKFFKLTELSKEEMLSIIGGCEEQSAPKYICACACAYQGQGGSSSHDNCQANHAEGWASPGL